MYLSKQSAGNSETNSFAKPARLSQPQAGLQTGRVSLYGSSAISVQ